MASQNQQGPRRIRENEHNGDASEIRERSSDVLRETINEFKEHGEDVKTLVTEYVKDKPLKALGIAVVTGMALALFMRR